MQDSDMTSDDWELSVQLVGGRSLPDDPLVAIGVLRGCGPKALTDVVVESRDSLVVVEGAALGMAHVDALEHRIPRALQSAIWTWHDEYASDGEPTEHEFVAEGERIVRELNDRLCDECTFYLDL